MKRWWPWLLGGGALLWLVTRQDEASVKQALAVYYGVDPSAVSIVDNGDGRVDATVTRAAGTVTLVASSVGGLLTTAKLQPA